MLLHDILDLLLLEVLKLVLFHVKTDFGTAAERWVDGIGSNGKGTPGSRFPDVLLVVIVF
jgi:hypothetical protein